MAEYLAYFKTDLVLIVTVVLAAVFLWHGYRKGLVRMLASLLSVALAVGVSVFAAPQLAASMSENHAWSSWVEANVLPHLPGVESETIFTVISFAAVFILSLALIKLLALTLDKIMHLPILNFINKALGALLGLLEATVYVWVLMMVVHILPHIPICQRAVTEIAENPLLSAIYENNLLRAFLEGLS